MKKYCCLLLSLIILGVSVSLAACSNDKGGNSRVSGGISSSSTGGRAAGQIHTGISF